jgi:hypothetical protein
MVLEPINKGLERDIWCLALGRVTLSYRMLFQREYSLLQRTFKVHLLDRALREAFELVMQACWSEVAALSTADVPLVLDAMNLMGVVDNRAKILEVRQLIETVKAELEEQKEILSRLLSNNGKCRILS